MTIPNKQGLKVYQSFEVINSKLRCGWIKESDFDKLNNNTVYDRKERLSDPLRSCPARR